MSISIKKIIKSNRTKNDNYCRELNTSECFISSEVLYSEFQINNELVLKKNWLCSCFLCQVSDDRTRNMFNHLTESQGLTEKNKA